MNVEVPGACPAVEWDGTKLRGLQAARLAYYSTKRSGSGKEPDHLLPGLRELNVGAARLCLVRVTEVDLPGGARDVGDPYQEPVFVDRDRRIDSLTAPITTTRLRAVRMAYLPSTVTLHIAPQANALGGGQVVNGSAAPLRGQVTPARPAARW